MNQFNFVQVQEQQKELIQEVRNIILSYPDPGIYKNHISKQAWNVFIDYFKNVICKQEGERGELSKQIQRELLLLSNDLDQLFTELNINMNSKTHIKFIAVFFESYNSSSLHKEYLKKQYTLAKFEQQYKDLSEKNNSKRQEIIDSLMNKYSKEETEEKYKQIVENLLKRYEDCSKEFQDIFIKLQECQKYQKYLKLYGLLSPFIEKWNKVIQFNTTIKLKIDSQVGKDNTSRGGNFESICNTIGIDIVLHRLSLAREDVEVKQNLYWTDHKGEIDFTIFDKNKNIIVLVECKSRLFDVAEGHLQSSAEGRKINGKKQLIDNGIIRNVDEGVPCFVITVIPPHHYNLGFESEIKVELNKITKQLSLQQIEQYDFDVIFEKFLIKFNNRLHPLNWIQQNSDYLIIIPQELV